MTIKEILQERSKRKPAITQYLIGSSPCQQPIIRFLNLSSHRTRLAGPARLESGLRAATPVVVRLKEEKGTKLLIARDRVRGLRERLTL